MRLSKHFKEKWHDRLGEWPRYKQVISFLREAICVQPYRNSGNGQSVLGIYWNYRQNLLFKLDEERQVLVTVYVGRPCLPLPDRQAGIIQKKKGD